MSAPIFSRIDFISDANIGDFTSPVYTVARQIVLKSSNEAPASRDIWMIAQTTDIGENYFAHYRYTLSEGWVLVSESSTKTQEELLVSVNTIPLVSAFSIISETEFNELDVLMQSLV